MVQRAASAYLLILANDWLAGHSPRYSKESRTILVFVVLFPGKLCNSQWPNYGKLGLPIQLLPEYPVVCVLWIDRKVRAVFKVHDYGRIITNYDRFPRLSSMVRLRSFSFAVGWLPGFSYFSSTGADCTTESSADFLTRLMLYSICDGDNRSFLTLLTVSSCQQNFWGPQLHLRRLCLRTQI